MMRTRTPKVEVPGQYFHEWAKDKTDFDDTVLQDEDVPNPETVGASRLIYWVLGPSKCREAEASNTINEMIVRKGIIISKMVKDREQGRNF